MEGIQGPAFVFEISTLWRPPGGWSQKLNEQQLKSFGKVTYSDAHWRRRAPWDPIWREVLAQLKPKIAIPMHHRDNPYLITIQRRAQNPVLNRPPWL
jgi:hypothetical protein